MTATAGRAAPRLLLIDNYDSFTYNLVQDFLVLGADVRVHRNDEITVEAAREIRPTHLCVSPGPGIPSDAGVSKEMIRAFAGQRPVLGVCLGHQAVIEVYGGEIVRAERLMHGKASQVMHDGRGLYAGMPNPFPAGRYHSLIAKRDTVPDALRGHGMDRGRGGHGRATQDARTRGRAVPSRKHPDAGRAEAAVCIPALRGSRVKSVLGVAVLVACLGVVADCKASEPGFYIGADAALVAPTVQKSDGVNFGTPSGVVHVDPESVRFDESGFGWSGLIGYRINSHLAAELAYLDFGSIDVEEAFDLTDVSPGPPDPSLRNLRFQPASLRSHGQRDGNRANLGQVRGIRPCRRVVGEPGSPTGLTFQLQRRRGSVGTGHRAPGGTGARMVRKARIPALRGHARHRRFGRTSAGTIAAGRDVRSRNSGKASDRLRNACGCG